jgi:hypothetical protein
MGASASQAGGFPVLAAVLALFMLGYIVWTTDRLTTLAQARPTSADLRRNSGLSHRQRPWRRPQDSSRASGTPGAAGSEYEGQASRPVLAPRLAVCGKLAMSIAMGYMLILML